MGQLIVGGLGLAAGSALGNPMMGFSLGMTLGGILFPQGTTNIRPNLNVQGSDYGSAIPIVFGEWRIAGNMVWSIPLVEEDYDVTGGGGGGSGGLLNQSNGPYYYLYAAFMLCEGPVSLLKVWADSDLIIDYTHTPPLYAPFVHSTMFDFHPGSSNATDTGMGQDPTIFATWGASQTPAYTNRATFVVRGFPWSRYGHTPNFTFLVQQAASPGLDTVLLNLFSRIAPTGILDFSAVAGITVDGYCISGRQSLASAIQPLQDAYHFDVVEVDGKIQAVLRSVAPSFVIDPKWMGVATNGRPPDVPVTPTRAPDTELPRYLDVAYASASRDFQTASQTVQRFVTASQASDSLSLPLVLSDNDARQLGEAALYERWIHRSGYKLTYTPDYLSIAPGDVGTITVNGQLVTIRIIDQTMGMLGHLESNAVAHDPSIYTQILPGAGFSYGSINPGSGTLTGAAGDINAPLDSMVWVNGETEHGIVAFALARPGGSWRGGGIAIFSGESVYGWRNTKIQSSVLVPRMSSYGVSAYALPIVDPSYIDTTSTLTVAMTNGVPTSCSDADFLRGTSNLAMIGNEMIQFRDVIQVSVGVYALSHLMRGKRGTEGAISSHVANEPFVLVNSLSNYMDTSAFYAQNPPTADFTGYEDDTDPSTFVTFTGIPLPANNLKCYAPCNLAASRDMAGNITLTWNRRSRIGGINPWDVGFDTYDEARRVYEVYIVDVIMSGSVAKTYTVTAQQGGTVYLTSPSLTISAADQRAMSGGLMSPISVKVYQCNYFMPVSNGRGYPLAASL